MCWSPGPSWARGPLICFCYELTQRLRILRKKGVSIGADDAVMDLAKELNLVDLS